MKCKLYYKNKNGKIYQYIDRNNEVFYVVYDKNGDFQEKIVGCFRIKDYL